METECMGRITTVSTEPIACAAPCSTEIDRIRILRRTDASNPRRADAARRDSLPTHFYSGTQNMIASAVMQIGAPSIDCLSKEPSMEPSAHDLAEISSDVQPPASIEAGIIATLGSNGHASGPET